MRHVNVNEITRQSENITTIMLYSMAFAGAIAKFTRELTCILVWQTWRPEVDLLLSCACRVLDLFYGEK